MRKTSPLKREPELKLEGKLECQPEYRKAYVNYIKRERIDRKSRPIDNLMTAEQYRRIFDEKDNNREIVKDKKDNTNKAPNKNEGL